jgi:hypothetical protein
MFAALLLLLFALGAPQPPATQSDSVSQRDSAKAKAEAHRQAAIHINKLAGAIHSETDARNFVDAIVGQFSESQLQFWMTGAIRHRVAHAEYKTVSDQADLIPEERIAAVWNEYVREIDAPAEALVTVAEVHNLRDATYTMSKVMWKKDLHNLWTMPGIYAVGADGKIANGCRAIEGVNILYSMFRFFENVRSARQRVAKGVLVSEMLASDGMEQRQWRASSRPQSAKAQLAGRKPDDLLLSTEREYVQTHGDLDYQLLLGRLFEQVFPAE